MNTLEIYWSGVGVSFNGEHTRDGVRVISICAIPVDETTSDIFAGYWIDTESGDFDGRLAAAAVLEKAGSGAVGGCGFPGAAHVGEWLLSGCR